MSLMSSEIAFRRESSQTFHQMLAAMQFWGFMCGVKCRLYQEMDQLMITIPGEEAKLIFLLILFQNGKMFVGAV